MTFAELQLAAREARDRHDRLAEKLSGITFAPEHRANLIGPRPTWADYVIGLGEPFAPGPGVAMTMGPEGMVLAETAAELRTFAIHLLTVADEMDAAFADGEAVLEAPP